MGDRLRVGGLRGVMARWVRGHGPTLGDNFLDILVARPDQFI